MLEKTKLEIKSENEIFHLSRLGFNDIDIVYDSFQPLTYFKMVMVSLEAHG